MLTVMKEQQIQEIELLLEKVQKTYYNGKLQETFELLEKGESLVNKEGFQYYLKTQFYLQCCEILVTSGFLEKRSFDSVAGKLQICDSLIQNNQSLDYARLCIQYAIAWNYKPVSDSGEKIGNQNVAIDYIIKAIEILENIREPKYLSIAYFYRGRFFEKVNQFEEAKKWYSNSYHLAKNTNNSIERSFAGRHLGILEMKIGDPEEAERLLTESLKLRDETGFRIGIPFSILSLGDLNIRKQDYQKALEFYKTGYEAATDIGIKNAQAIGSISIGRTYIRLNLFQKAIPYLEKGIGIAEELNNQELALLGKKTLETRSVD